MKNKILLWLLCISMSLSGLSIQASASEPSLLEGEDLAEALRIISANNTDWGRCELNGKLTCDLIPIPVTVKLYMDKNRELMLSARAPFVGEVFRLEVYGDTLLAVNKRARTYALETWQGVRQNYPNLLQDIQSLLLGRVMIAGFGPVSNRVTDEAFIMSVDDGYMVVPGDAYTVDEASYGYILNPDGLPANLIVNLRSGVDIEIDYSYPGDKTRLDLILERQLGDRTVVQEFSLQFDAPKWGVRAPERFTVTDKYREVPVKKLLSTF